MLSQGARDSEVQKVEFVTGFSIPNLFREIEDI
jgi:hypothetical protein